MTKKTFRSIKRDYSRHALQRAAALAVIALSLCGILVAIQAFGQTSDEFPGFRYWKAPENAIDRWPWGGEKYLPITIEKFNDWIRVDAEEKRRREYAAGQIFVDGVAKMTLNANLVGDSLQGVGEIVSHPFSNDGDNVAPEAFLFPIPNLSLALEFDRQRSDVALETQIATYPDRKLYLPTKRGGARPFLWSKRGALNESGDLLFDLKFPVAVDAELTIVTGAEEVVSIPGAALETSTFSENGIAKRQWRAYLGGRTEATVILARPTAQEAVRKPGFRQDLTYRVALEGVELTSKWEFDAAQAPIGDLEIEFDDELAILAVEWGNAILGSTPKPEQKLDGQKSIAIRAPARNADGTIPELKITAFYPLDFARRPAPTVRLRAQAVIWRETLCRILIAAPLERSFVQPINAVQTRDPARARTDEQNTIAFKFFDQNARVVLEFEKIETTAPFDSATDCLFVENNVSAKTTLFFNFDDVARKSVDLPIAENWQIDSVQASQEEELVWTCEPDPNRNNRELLRLAFKTPPTPNQPTRVTLAARYEGVVGDKVPVDSLRPIDLTNALLGAHALILRSDSASQVKLTTKTGRPFVASKGKPNFIFGEAQLREATSATVGVARLYFGDQTAGLYATLERARTNYSVDPNCRLAINALELKETWNLRCVPNEGMRVDRVVFFVAPGTTTQDPAQETVANNLPWTWASAAEPEKIYRANLLAREEADALRAPENADAYEIKLQTSRSVPFDLKVFYSTPNAPYVDVPLLFFPENSHETAEIVLASNSDQPFRTIVNAMNESTPPTAESTRYGAQIKAFRYRPNAIFDATEPEPGAKETELDANKAPQISVELLASRRNRNELETLLPYNALCWFESYDSYYQKDGAVDHCATFYIENRGRSALKFYIEQPLSATLKTERKRKDASHESIDELEARNAIDNVRRAIRAVWLDERRAVWFVENVARNELGKLLCEVVVQIPSNKKFVRVEIEYADDIKRPIGGVRLKPLDIICEAPALSGVWTAWTPPQYITRDPQYLRRASSAPKGWIRAARNLITRSTESERTTTQLVELVAERLGDPFTLKTLISDARDADAKTEGRDPGALVAPRLDPPTWGDFFGSPSFVEKIAERSEAEEDAPKKSTTLRVDQFALARAGIAPSTLAPLDATLTPSENAAVRRENAAKLLADAGIVLLFLDEDFAIVTTDDALAIWNDLETESVVGRSFRRVRATGDARALRDDLARSNSKRFVSPSQWRAMIGATSPWISRSHSLEAKGWERAAAPLGRAHEGAYFVNRYRLATLALATFLATLASGRALWRLGARAPLALAGLACATAVITHYELASIAKGALWGALAIFCWRIFQGVASPELDEPDADRNVEDSRESSSLVLESDASQSLAGFVDFNHMPEDVAQYLREKAEQATRQNVEDAPQRGGKTNGATIVAILACALAMAAATIARGQEKNAERESAMEPQSALDALNGLFPLSNDVAQVREPARAQDRAWREPYRVFAPYDAQGEVVGDYYWISDEFYDRIRNALRNRPRKKNWRVVDAVYSGVVSYNSFSKVTSVYQLRAIYDVVLDEESATIALPAAQLTADSGARFDSEVVAVGYDENSNEMTFEVVGKPGVHRLELSLETPTFIETANEIRTPILPVASARLELDVDLDAPALNAPNALGAVSRTPTKFTAQLGPVDTLVIQKEDVATRELKSSVDVEQYLLMRPRPTQTDVRAAFKFQVQAGKIDRVEIECDPAFAFSGYCKCDAAEIENVEAPTAQNSAMRVTFKSPAPANFTLNVDFVTRNFAGVGALPIPQIKTIGARIVKNWLAVAPAQGIELEKRKSENANVEQAESSARANELQENAALASDFIDAWGASDEQIEVVYDLANAPRNETVNVRLKSYLPTVEEDVSYLFRPSYVETIYLAAIDAESEVFQMSFDIPSPFVVDSVALYDEQGEELDAPNFVVSQDALTLVFDEPLKGKRSLNLVGRTKEVVEQERAFPIVRACDVKYVKRNARLYAAPNLYLEWPKLPDSWTQIERDFGAEPVGDDVYPFEAYAIERRESDDSNPNDYSNEELPTLRAVMNAPAAEGVERVALYPSMKDGAPIWKAAYSLVFRVTEGKFDRIVVRADELFDADSLQSDPTFRMRESTTAEGVKVYVFEPKKTILDDDKDYEIFFQTVFKSEEENLRLPNFQLVTSPLREDYSKITRRVLLAVEQNDRNFSWAKRGLTPVRTFSQDGEERRLTRGVNALARNGVASRKEKELEEKRQSQLENTTEPETNDGDDAALAVRNFLEALAQNDGVRFVTFSRAHDAEANLSARGSRLEVSLAQHSFYINDRREIFGLVSFLIQPGERSQCELVAPPKCHVLEASVNGARRLVERKIELNENEDATENENRNLNDESETRWLVDLDGSPYAKRLVVAFYSEPRMAEKSDPRIAQRRAEEFNVDFLRIADAKTARVVWTCAFEDFESSAVDANWKLRAIVKDSKTPNGEETIEVNADCAPVTVADASPALQRLMTLDAATTLAAYESDSARLAGAQADDKQRFSERWIAALEHVKDALAQFTDESRQSVEFDDQLARAALEIENGSALDPEKINYYFPTLDWRAKFGDLATVKKRCEDALQKEKGTEEYSNARDAYSISPETLWALETGANARAVFGAADAEIMSILVVATPKPFDFFASSYAVALFILMATAFALQILKHDSGSRVKTGLALACALFLWTALFFYLNLSGVALAGAFFGALLPLLSRKTGKPNEGQIPAEPERSRDEEDSDVGRVARVQVDDALNSTSYKIVEPISQMGGKELFENDDSHEIHD